MILLWLAACGGPCSDGELAEVSKALGVVSREHRSQLAAQGLMEACDFAPPVEEALSALAMGVPGTAAMIDAKVAADAPDLWSAACPGGPGSLADAMSMGGSAARRKLYTDCELSRWGWGESTFAAASGPVVLPIVLSHAMSGESSFHRTVAIDALAGL